MLEGIFGNASAEKVLLYLEQYEEGHAIAIARTFENLSLNMAQRQLERFERAGAWVSSLRGRTRLYTWNARYLNAALGEEDPEVFLLALRDVARTREGGLAGLAETA